MKKKLENLIEQAVISLKQTGIIADDITVNIILERSRDPQHGDFATNLAMLLAKPAKMNPRQLAEKLVAALPSDESVLKVEIAGPGFINFFLDSRSQFAIVKQIHEQGPDFGRSQVGAGQENPSGICVRQPHRPFACRAWPWRGLWFSGGGFARSRWVYGASGILRQRCRTADGHPCHQYLAEILGKMW